jgi:hypothetical protein
VSEEKDGGRPLSRHCDQRPEVGISGDDDALLISRSIEDVRVARGLQLVVSHVYGVVSGVLQASGHNGFLRRVVM